MKIVNVGFHNCHSEDFCVNRPNGSGDYVLMIIKSTAYFVLNGQKQTAYPNSVILFKKDTPQLFGALGEKYINDWIHFDLDANEIEKINNLEIPFDTLLTFVDTIDLSKLIKDIFLEYFSQDIYKEQLLDHLFDILLLKLSAKIKFLGTTIDHIHYNDFLAMRKHIYLNPSKDWNISDICKSLNLSRSHLQHLYKSFFGTSIFADITNSRINHAKHLLISTNMPISNIATLCGYNSDVHFINMFKKIVLFTPSQYREDKH